MADYEILDDALIVRLPADADVDELAEALAPMLENGWEWITPEEIGALTDAPIISDEATRDDYGNLSELGRVFWYSSYMILDPVEEMKGDGARFEMVR
jgi:hypothetical protein